MRRTLALFGLFLSACVSTKTVEMKQEIAVSATPEDATIWQEDQAGRRAIGQGSVTVERTYQETKLESNKGCWVAPVLGAIGTGIGIGALVDHVGASESRPGEFNGPSPVGLVTTMLGGLMFVIATPVCAAFMAQDGETISSTGERLSFTAEREGYNDELAIVNVPSDMKKLELTLHPKAAVVGGLGVADLTASQRNVVAVFDLQDPEGKLSSRTIDQLTDWLTTQLTATARFEVVPREQLRARLVEEKASGYKECFDVACQIELGKAVAAQKTIVSKVLRIGNTCAVTAVLYDLRREAAEKASSATTDCTDENLLASISTITKDLAAQPVVSR